MNNFNQVLRAHFGPLTSEDVKIVQSYFRSEQLSKQDFFTRSGKVCDKMSFVVSGIMRVYAEADSKEITQWICTSDFLFTDVLGFFFDQPNRWHVQALTDVELLTVTKADYRKLCREFPKWNEIEKGFIVKCFSMMEERVFSHLSMTAEERYARYFDQHKALFNQVPLHYIASVLGMTAETFSRIRKRQAGSS